MAKVVDRHDPIQDQAERPAGLADEAVRHLSEGRPVRETLAKAVHNPPTAKELADQNDKDWDKYKQDQLKREDVKPDELDKFVAYRREKDAQELATLSDKDRKAVGDVATALAGPNGPEKAISLMKQNFEVPYDEKKMSAVDTALKLELERRNTDNQWGISLAWGPTGAYVHVQDRRTNLAQNGGTTYQTYSGEIGQVGQ